MKEDEFMQVQSNATGSKLSRYFKNLGIVLGINCILAGIIMVIGHFLLKTEFSGGTFSNAMFAISVLYMLYCYGIFLGDINSRLDSSNLELSSTNFNGKKKSQRLTDGFSRTESIFAAASYMVATIGIAFLAALI